VAAAIWCLLGCASVQAIAPKYLAGAALAFVLGFGSHLAIDAFTERGIFLWPRALSPTEWLMPYRPEDLVELDGQLFVVPSVDGAVARPWGGWRFLTFHPEGSGRGALYRAVGHLSPCTGLLLSAASLAALLAAVIIA